MDETTPVPAEELAFGEALSELEGIVASLESGALELEDSLTRYERGVSLLRVLQGKLADAQLRVQMLVGELETEQVAEESASE